MQNTNDTSNDNKSIIKAKSYSSGPPKKLKNIPVKRKSFNTNEAINSLDLVGGRLKKSKLVIGESTTSSDHTNPVQGYNTQDMFIDSVATPSVNFIDVENTSSISINFSHYELMRNISLSNCSSNEAVGSTYGAFSSLTDIASRNENLERYFRSLDMWSRGPKTNGT